MFMRSPLASAPFRNRNASGGRFLLQTLFMRSRHSIDVIARQTGFADRYRMRRAFRRAFGQPPQVIRRNVRAELAA
jgi:AraC-like DNA-binding protein